MQLVIPRLYAIIDPAQAEGRTADEVAEALLSAGVKLIQLRNKQVTSRDLFESARRIGARAQPWGARFIVNDRADIARAVGADGVHVGQQDLPVELARSILGADRWVGYSTHVLEQVREADCSSADYIAFGPIFPTVSKQNPDWVVGLEGLRQARQATRKPLVAIGGITLENVQSVMEAGADSVAIIRGLVCAEDISGRAKEFLKILGF